MKKINVWSVVMLNNSADPDSKINDNPNENTAGNPEWDSYYAEEDLGYTDEMYDECFGEAEELFLNQLICD